MKKIIAMLLMTALLLSGCGQKAEPVPTTTAAPETTEAPVETTTEATTEPTTVPTTEPPKVYFNPLNGEILDEPYTGRVFAHTISNIPQALPHVGVNDADILMEMFVNNSIIRCLALYTDVSGIGAIGSTRSTRLMFNDITQHYDAILCHASGSNQVLKDAADRGIDNVNVENWTLNKEYNMSYRDEEHKRGFEHSLFSIGDGLNAFAAGEGLRTSQDPEKDYQLRFTEDGTPVDGEDANEITITITYGRTKKETVMTYDAEIGEYIYSQYGQVMADQLTEEIETYENVIVMYTQLTMDGIYHKADFVAGGTGYFACGGKYIPITWECDDEDSPFRFMTMDGEILELGQGRTYIAITQPDSSVVWG